MFDFIINSFYESDCRLFVYGIRQGLVLIIGIIENQEARDTYFVFVYNNRSVYTHDHATD